MIYSKIPPEYINLVKDSLTYEKEIWVKTKYGKRKKTYDECLISLAGRFLSGFEEKVSSLTGLNFPVDDFSYSELELHGITPNKPQLRLIEKSKEKSRGIFIAPTGFGKTIICAGILSVHKKYKTIILCNRVSLLFQTADNLEKILQTKVNKLGAGFVELSPDNNITVATIGTAVSYTDYFMDNEIVIIDECHRCASLTGQFFRFLSAIKAQKTYGLTATIPKDKEKSLIMEGMIGSVIESVSIEEGKLYGRIVPVKVHMIKVDLKMSKSARYQTAYKALTTNKMRNKEIFNIVKEKMQKNESCLICVKLIKHGEIIKDSISELRPLFVSGSSSIRMREYAKKCLDRATRPVIATTIFDEAIDIPSLNNVILAGGGESDTALLQKIGRGMRKVNGKDHVNVYDFYDKGKYVEKHSKSRMEIYKKMRWI